MTDFNLSDKFPDMKPIRQAPSLYTVNGIGMNVYGSRDYDDETHTYVKTHCFCLFFIPLVAVGAYRVADAEQGWLFLGRVPLSAFAKAWNMLLLLLIVGSCGLIYWNVHTNSPEYVARANLARADELVAEGNVANAAQLYRAVARGTTSEATHAREKMRHLITEKLSSAPPAEASKVLHMARDLKIDGLVDATVKLAKHHTVNNPQAALALLEIVNPLLYGQQQKAVQQQRREILEQLVKQDPKNLDRIIELANVYDSTGDQKKCETLLTAHKARLGNSDAARLLGQIYARQGKVDEALALLVPYTKTRLETFKTTFQNYNGARRQAETRILNRLRGGKAPNFPYSTFKGKSKQEQARLVNTYIDKALANDVVLKEAGDKMRKQSAVVPATLDVGLLLLRRSQQASDAAARTKDLKQAEKMFLSIGQFAGGTDRYRLNLAQVYHWLGQHDKGKKMLDDLLRERNRDYQTLLRVGNIYREIGLSDQAKTVIEEAYNKTENLGERQHAAVQRSLLALDLDEQITWLKRGDLSMPRYQAQLHSSLARKALRDGDDATAIREFKQSIAIYEKQAEGASMFNNNGLNYMGLYGASGNRDALDKGVALLERAVKLQPSNSILLQNVAELILQTAYRDAIGEQIPIEQLRLQAGSALLTYLFDDLAGQNKIHAQVRNHVGFTKSRRHFERLLILKPNSTGVYRYLAKIYDVAGASDRLADLAKRIADVKFPLNANHRETIDFFKGKDTAKHRKRTERSVKRMEKLLNMARKKGGQTLAVAASIHAGNLIQLSRYDAKVTPDDIVQLAEDANKAAPSSATRAILATTLLFRAGHALRKTEPEFAKLWDKAERVYSPAYLIAYVLTDEETLSKAVLANADVRRAVELIKEIATKFPDKPGEWVWAMLHKTAPEQAKQIAASYKKNNDSRNLRVIHRQIDLVNPDLALEAQWAASITGDEKSAIAVMRQLTQRGVPLPLVAK